MDRESQQERAELDAGARALWRLALVAVIAGLLIGVVGAAFRLVLRAATDLRLHFADYAHGLGWWGILLPIAGAAAGAGLARLLVRWAPEAGGSGVQHVEAVMRGDVGPAPLKVLPVKFAGGVLALGSGLVLGREGPTVQMGASIGVALAALFRLPDADMRDLQASSAGAGLGVAFSAPIGGAMFTFEEVRRAFTARLAVATLLAASAAWTVGFLILGGSPDFSVRTLTMLSWDTMPAILVFGALMGVLGVAYNRLVMLLLGLSARVAAVPPEIRAAIIGAVVGALLWFEPRLVGGGDPVTQAALGAALPAGTVALLLVFRWFLGPISYSAGAPGGLFAPLLVLGALFGALFAAGWNRLAPGVPIDSIALSMIGMSTFFAATVRAPFTGVLLVVEMTAATSQIVPMMAAAGMAVAAATIIKGPPIYDTLRIRMLRDEAADHPDGSPPGQERNTPAPSAGAGDS
jgi:CIC family chloride channel protein